MTAPGATPKREPLGARLVTRGGLGFAVVLLPGLRFGWRGAAAAVVAGGLAAATVLVQRQAVARGRSGRHTRAALEASGAAALLAVVGIVQVAVLLATRGAGPEAQVASVAQLLGRLSAGDLALRAVALLAAGIVLGGPVGAATLLELEPSSGHVAADEAGAARWLFGGVGLATGLLVVACVGVALAMKPFDPALPLVLLLGAVFGPAVGTGFVVLPVALLEGVLHELVLAVEAWRRR